MPDENQTKEDKALDFNENTPQQEVVTALAKAVQEMKGNPVGLMIRPRTAELIKTQMQLALGGVTLLFKKERDDEKANWGKNYQVDDKQEFEDFLNGVIKSDELTHYTITTTMGDNTAINSLLDRAYGKPKQQIELDQKVETRVIDEVTYVVPEMPVLGEIVSDNPEEDERS